MSKQSSLPLSQRIVYDHSDCKSTKLSRVTTERPQSATSGGYDETSMQMAIAAVERQEMTMRRAAICYGIAPSTLHDRISGKVKEGATRGAVPYLTKQEEEEFASFLARCADIGYAHSLPQVLALAQQIVDRKGINTMVTRGWWKRFCQRNPQLSHRTAVPLTVARAMATDAHVMNCYFEMLTDTLSDNGLIHKPMHLYNCDETGMPLGAYHHKVVAQAGSNPTCITSNSKTQVTVLACVSATGVAMPPFVIFKRKTMNQELTIGEIPGTLYGCSETGWINQKLFSHWFLNHFLRYMPTFRPVVLLMDGHSSHFCPDMIRMAAEEKVILFTLPPHTTHLTQPLDKGCFGPFKVAWRQTCHKFCSQNPGRVVTVYDFSKLLSEAWSESMTVKNITSGFKVTGVYPVDKNAVQIPGQKPAFKPESLAEKSGLAYIPLYSPAPSRHSQKVMATYEENEMSIVSECPHQSYLNSDTSPDFSFLQRSLSENNISIQSSSEASLLMQPYSSSLSSLLNTPIPPAKLRAKNVKACGQVLTSTDVMKKIEEAEKLKADKAKEKKERERKRLEKAKQKSVKVPQKDKRREEAVERKKTLLKKQPARTVKKKPVAGVQGSYSSTDEEIQGEFSEAELKRFSIRYENGYNIKSDERYNAWLRRYHPTEKPTKKVAEKEKRREETVERKKRLLKKPPTRTVNRQSVTSLQGAAADEEVQGEFSEAELKRFSIRYENGYDIKSDERYNAWLRRYHPTEKSTKKARMVKKPVTNSQNSAADEETQEDSDHDLKLCEAEVCIIKQFNQEKVQWINCDKCSCWLHKYCCGLLESANPKKFTCDRH